MSKIFISLRRGGKNKAIRDELIQKLLENPNLTINFGNCNGLELLKEVYKELAVIGARAQHEQNRDLNFAVSEARKATKRLASNLTIEHIEPFLDMKEDSEFIMKELDVIMNGILEERPVEIDEANFVTPEMWAELSGTN